MLGAVKQTIVACNCFLTRLHVVRSYRRELSGVLYTFSALYVLSVRMSRQ